MEDILSASDKQVMVSNFLEIAVGQTADTARQFLQLCDKGHPAVWEAEQGGSSTTDSSRDNLAAMFRPPFALMTQGPFEKAKLTAASSDQWLVANLQSPTEFSSHMLNRDTWANEAVAQTIKTNFIFWQVYDDTSEGKKVCNYYKIESVSVILVIDPITGQKMRSWSGMVHPDRLLEDLLPFMDSGPHNHHSSLSHKRPRESSNVPAQKVQGETTVDEEELQRALAASMENMNHPDEIASEDKDAVTANKEEAKCSTKIPVYPPLPEEPKGDRNLLCRVGFRLPDGRRVQRNFLRTGPIQLLWSFCRSQLGEAETRPLRLTHGVLGAAKSVEYDSNLTFEESGLSNSMISVTWE
ncbi:plant UBX domain-containing protein 7-like isoform X1 [Chenopodium quinoa]|uniref:UBX domain-containing protein n=1 Tax=Chenopodium quinoa TaxID=63459 RepID=A0A803KWR5_CHEQI|nr:plant UBX domain-containing protein 7-like isoform X1 [Chenopodium quinoa]